MQFLANFVSQINQTHSEAMVKTMDMIISYVILTKGIGLTYGGPHTDLILQGYSDSSFGAHLKNENQCSSYVDIRSRWTLYSNNKDIPPHHSQQPKPNSWPRKRQYHKQHTCVLYLKMWRILQGVQHSSTFIIKPQLKKDSFNTSNMSM